MTSTRITLALVSVLAAACAMEGGPSRPEGSSPALSDGEAIYARPRPDGNTFACATCHALSEPADDGIRRPGHPIGDAANRASYKNGQLGSLREAVNTCLDEWMGADPLSEDDEDWLLLEEFLMEQAGTAPAPELAFERVDPPADVSGGDAMAGEQTYHETCVVCHAADGEGSQQAPPLQGARVPAERVAERVRRSGNTNSAVYPGLTGGRMPFWSLDRLSEQELLDVVAYVEAIGTFESDPDPDPVDPGPMGSGCDATDPRVGQVATLQERQHDVGGQVRIVDDCTLEVTGFTFDGAGIDVRFYTGVSGDFSDGVSIGPNLVRRGGYDGETITLRLPDGLTLADFDSISVWCIPVGLSFGDGQFQ